MPLPPPPPDRPRADLWQCHHCRDGYVSIQLHPACLGCGHQLKDCPYCKLAKAARALGRGFSRAPSNQGTSRPLLQFHTLDSLSPIENDTSSSILPAYPTPPPEAGNAPLPVNELGPTRTYWYCHNCCDGPWLLENHVACTSCNHPRCGYCSVVYSK
jgi:hypothetical protein